MPSKRTFVQLQTCALFVILFFYILACTVYSETEHTQRIVGPKDRSIVPRKLTFVARLPSHAFFVIDLFYFIFMQSVQWDRQTGSMVPVGSSVRDSTPSDAFGDPPLGHTCGFFSSLAYHYHVQPLFQP